MDGVTRDQKQFRVYKWACARAQGFANQAVSISIKLKDKELEGWSNHWLAFTHMLAGDTTSAEEPIESAMAIARETNDLKLQVRAMMLTAQSHLARGDRDKAVQVLNDATILALDIDEEIQQMVADLLESTVVMPEPEAPLPVPEEPEPMIPTRRQLMGLDQIMIASSLDLQTDAPLVRSGLRSSQLVEPWQSEIDRIESGEAMDV